MKNYTFPLCAVLLLFALPPLSAGTFPTSAPTTTNNDDSCDIALLPAATLLVPYFEVDLAGAGAQTTIVTVTNTSNLPQAFAMTLWTDYGYPVATFRFYLTGYDVQSINLFDVIRRGQLAPNTGTGSDVSPVGRLSGNPVTGEDTDNPLLDESTCVRMPVQLPQVYIQRMQDALTRGTVPAIGTFPGCTSIGGTHSNAIGYATIDVVGVCGLTLPTDPGYFNAELGYANVLMGDYVQVDGLNDFAQGSPAVHIRAIPEGGTPSTRKATNLRRTFYSHLQPSASRTLDGRQPLPSTFAARWIDGGTGNFDTFFKIWREARTASSAACSEYAANGSMPVVEIVRFDEEENPETNFTQSIADPPREFAPTLPAASLVPIDSQTLPINTTGALSGWMYLNLDDGLGDDVAAQNWIVISMRAEDRFSADTDAVSLGNGCSAAIPRSNANVKDAQPIGPAPNTTP
jgi:hypothetical protein